MLGDYRRLEFTNDNMFNLFVQIIWLAQYELPAIMILIVILSVITAPCFPNA